VTLQRTAVVVRERYLLEGYAFQAPNVDGGHAVTFSIRAFAVRVNSTHRTETVFDSVLVEKIGARILFRRKQAQFLTRHEPHSSCPLIDPPEYRCGSRGGTHRMRAVQAGARFQAGVGRRSMTVGPERRPKEQEFKVLGHTQ